MIQVVCPTCKKPLQIPESAQGKQVRCPLCQGIFQVGVVAVPAAPPPQAIVLPSPPPPPPTPIHAPPPSPAPEQAFDFAGNGPPDQRDELDFDRSDEEGTMRIRARGRARAVASLVYGSVALDFLVALIFTASLFLNNAPRYRMAALLFFYVIFIPLVVFIIIGAANLTNLANRGLVLTGGIMALIGGALLAIWSLILLLAIFRLVAMVGVGPLMWLLPILLAYAGGATLNIIAGVKVLVVICRPEVRACFPDFEDYPEPRRRRRRPEDDYYDRR